MEFLPFLKYFLGLIFVLGLIAGAAYLARRFGMVAKVSQRVSGDKRLAITEVLAVDAKRRLILIKRDDKEHLILLGSERDLVIETDIDAPEETPKTTEQS